MTAAGARRAATAPELFSGADARPLPPLREADLARLWEGQRLPAGALTTRDGQTLRVLHPGRRGRGAGPDFRDAIIAPPSGRLLRGDVELHVRAGDFRAHGHATDHRYDGLVLHVVFEDDRGEDTRLAGGRLVPVVALAAWVRGRAHELNGWLAGPRLWREPCHDAVARLGRDEVLRRLETLGDERFRAREDAIRSSIDRHGPGEALYRALLDGLGYGGARETFVALGERLPWRDLVAGASEAEQRACAAALERLLLEALGDAPWSGRPANRPSRRLAGLARLLARHGLAEDGLMSLGAPLDAALDAPARDIVRAWAVTAEGGALIGRSRAIELLANAVLPWAAARGGDDAGAARACWAALPRPGRYGALSFLEANLRDGGRALGIDLRRQQGLLALYKTECTQGGCGRCPLS